MKKGTKPGRWPGKLLKLKGERKSSLSTTETYPSHVKSVGSKAGALERPLNISLYDSCYTCPLSVYIDITVDDQLDRLIISGSPSREELEETKLKLISEFSEIAGGGEMKAYANVVSDYHKQQNLINGLELSLSLILAGRFEKAIEYLNERGGVKCSIPKGENEFNALVDKVSMKLKNRIAKFKETNNRYKALSSGKGGKPTRRYYNRILIMLSTCEIIKMQLNPKTMTVAEFAEYLNVFNEYQNHLKIKKYGKH
jgi:hypothetical protein